MLEDRVPMSGDTSAARAHNAYAGVWAAGLTLLAIFVAATVLWFMFHPV